ncbi:MAG TPA: phosphoribosylformylglycinamidine synthase subunit PurL [Acidimicrobiales bacterium]|nr:phosphoribosylformylglycinamidine synthase subunit PurL [Acidimicrobiales bacterium]
MTTVASQSSNDPDRDGAASEPIDSEVHRALGLTDDEAGQIEVTLGRRPNQLELAMYSVMWSEHCSYKSSRLHLRRLPTEAPHVLVGPGEGAGVVDVGDGVALALRIESHNHPSFIEPYQGAATGAGGILRDIFSMGARPIALMDPLRFGPLTDARSRWVAEGVVSGISGYGNSVGVPTIGGEAVFDPTYTGNPLVNVLALGILPVENLVLGRATGEGNLAVLLGSTTGRDGIGGVSVLASASFDEDGADDDKRPSVQVGDPFEEKRLIEACLELYARDLVVGVQDLGGAGITCATAETAAKGDSGMDVYVSEIPLREAGMNPVEIMTSESQERMLAIVTPEQLDDVLEVAERWEIRASVIGTVNTSGRLRVLTDPGTDAAVIADAPAKSLEEEAPLYDRPRAEPVDLAERRADDPARHLAGLDSPAQLGAALLAMLCDSSWIWSQYDHQLFLNTVTGPGSDAAVLRLRHPDTGVETGRGVALSTDGNHRWCAVDPKAGTAAVVAESLANLACVGARPLALVNCLNFGNPENPEVMWQFSESVDGMGDACRALDVPVIGGNVSFYNSSGDADIDPTPVVGTLGIIDALDRRPPGTTLQAGTRLVLLGPDPAGDGPAGNDPSGLAGSRWAFDHDLRGGSLVALDTELHARLCELVRGIVADGLVVGLSDVSEGGLAGALGEAVARSGLGAQITLPDGADPVPWLFGESPSRVMLCVHVDDVAEVHQRHLDSGVPASFLGTVTGDRLTVGAPDAVPVLDVDVDDLRVAWRDRLLDAFASGTTQG